MATAGTIIDKNTSSSSLAVNTNTATESICPKGWTLPNTTQTRSIGPDAGSTAYISNFPPILGGTYNDGTLYNEVVYGYWWGNEAYTSAKRYSLGYNGNNLYTSSSILRDYGLYIRCVQAP